MPRAVFSVSMPQWRGFATVSVMLSSRPSQHAILISSVFKWTTWSWLQAGNSSLCEGFHILSQVRHCIRHPATETTTFWKSPACVPQRDLLYQNALLFISSLFTSFPLLPFLFAPVAPKPPSCPINCHCYPTRPIQGWLEPSSTMWCSHSRFCNYRTEHKMICTTA
jgi:hypothetical protein